MKNFIELRKLSNEFYKDFPKKEFPEIESKQNRPYVVLLVKVRNLVFAIPLRTNIKHSYCYKFKKSDRQTNSSTGIDFSKAVVIRKEIYLGEKTDINDKEYLEIQEKYFFIISKFKKYVEGYITFKKDSSNEFLNKKYKFCTLKYFEDMLI
jgi:protein AbiQ